MSKLTFGLRTKIDPCIIVASNGRSGSTLMFDALWVACKRRHWFRRPTASFQESLASAPLAAGSLVKTHDYPDGLRGRENVKVLFCFGPTKASALSVYSAVERYGRVWVDQHFEHLHAKGPFDDLFKYDVLNQVEQLKQWGTFQEVPVLCLSYDAIWRRQKDVEDFLNLKITLPERVERARKSIPDDLLAKASQVYDPIDEVVAELPELFLASPEHSDVLDRLPVKTQSIS